MTIKFIGDVHGKLWEYEEIVMNSECPTIQVGDFGIGLGFNAVDLAEDWLKRGNHRFIRGNHDNPFEAEKSTQWIPDGTIEIIDNKKFMFVGGALSIDKDMRIEGFDWWKEEELNFSQAHDIFDSYVEAKPQVMVTHEGPLQVTKNLQRHQESSITKQLLTAMFDAHKPELWVFGHYHQSYNGYVEKTQFVCLEELEEWSH